MSSENPTRYWLLRTDVPDGPFDVKQIHQMLAAGTIGWQTSACPVGQSTWRPLVEIAGIGPVEATIAPRVDRPPAAPPAIGQVKGRAWNPKVIAGLGLLFMPMWAGVMAAINGKRLGSSLSIWVPLGIGFGYIAIALASELVTDSMLVSWLLYLGAVAALWFAVLREQGHLFDAQSASAHSDSGSWVWPSVAGVPCALIFLLGFVVGPLIPPDPWTVCEKFLAAKSDSERQNWATKNLRTSLGAFSTGRDKQWELIGEEPAPPDVGGYFVGYRLYSDTGPRRRTEGLFHLVNVNGDWKIEDVYVVWQDGMAFDPFGSVAMNPSLISSDARTAPVGAASNQNAVRPQGGAAAKPDQKGAKPPYVNGFVVGKFLSMVFQSKAAKAIGVGLIALCAAIARFGRSREQPAPSAKS